MPSGGPKIRVAALLRKAFLLILYDRGQHFHIINQCGDLNVAMTHQ